MERYYNTHIIEDTLDFIINRIFRRNAFKFFESFAKYWQEESLFYFGHKRDKEYSLVKEYINKYYSNFSFAVNETLKYDYCKNNHSYNLPEKIETQSVEDTNNQLNILLKDAEFISHHLNFFNGKTVREIKKYVNLISFELNPLAQYSNPGYVMFVYDSSKKAIKIIDVTKHIKNKSIY